MSQKDTAISEEPVERLRDALEYLRDESIRLQQDAVARAIVRALTIIAAQTAMRQHRNVLH